MTITDTITDLGFEQLDALVLEYHTWLGEQRLTPESADELLENTAVRLTDEQRGFLTEFVRRWDAAAYRAAAERKEP